MVGIYNWIGALYGACQMGLFFARRGRLSVSHAQAPARVPPMLVDIECMCMCVCIVKDTTYYIHIEVGRGGISVDNQLQSTSSL